MVSSRVALLLLATKVVIGPYLNNGIDRATNQVFSRSVRLEGEAVLEVCWTGPARECPSNLRSCSQTCRLPNRHFSDRRHGPSAVIVSGSVDAPNASDALLCVDLTTFIAAGRPNSLENPHEMATPQDDLRLCGGSQRAHNDDEDGSHHAR